MVRPDPRAPPREGVIAISPFKLKAAATGAACVVVGAAAGIVGASAAPRAKSTTTAKPAAPPLPQAYARSGACPRPLRRPRRSGRPGRARLRR